MMRWLVFALGIVVAAVGLYVVATLDPAPPAVDEIDPESRTRLERVLREAEEETERR